ncbi:MAG: phosphonoacetaldehyde reductase [Clostridiaceae bacterium]|nr:phosphonoacetaldehyde reductase [Clostridiaceae bacterium]
MQKILIASKDYKELDEYFTKNAIKRILLVCDGSIQFLKLNDYFSSLPERLDVEVIRFSDFQPNPLYESVVEGVELLHESACDAIIAVGGGSAIDVAKCIKLYSNMDSSVNYLKQDIVPNGLKLLVVPTTAGTGSEATRYAVIYYNGEKQSVTDYSCIPSTVLMDASVLNTLPIYQKKSTMLDALCHSIESFWSVNSTDESKEYSKQAIKIIMENLDDYISNEDSGNENMLKAANLAGKAINITQTTAGHAMCYKLTSLYGVAHGHAAALCVRKLWPFMLENTDRCIDPRGEEYLKNTFDEIAEAMGCGSATNAAAKFQEIFEGLGMSVPEPNEGDYELLKTSVNPVRLKNHPIRLDEEVIDNLYHQILG